MTRNETVARHGSTESSWSSRSGDTIRPYGRQGSLRGTPVTVRTSKDPSLYVMSGAFVACGKSWRWSLAGAAARTRCWRRRRASTSPRPLWCYTGEHFQTVSLAPVWGCPPMALERGRSPRASPVSPRLTAARH